MRRLYEIINNFKICVEDINSIRLSLFAYVRAIHLKIINYNYYTCCVYIVNIIPSSIYSFNY